MPQVCFPCATEAREQTLEEKMDFMRITTHVQGQEFTSDPNASHGTKLALESLYRH